MQVTFTIQNRTAVNFSYFTPIKYPLNAGMGLIQGCIFINMKIRIIS